LKSEFRIVNRFDSVISFLKVVFFSGLPIFEGKSERNTGSTTGKNVALDGILEEEAEGDDSSLLFNGYYLYNWSEPASTRWELIGAMLIGTTVMFSACEFCRKKIYRLVRQKIAEKAKEQSKGE
jgi:hypothetical protein